MTKKIQGRLSLSFHAMSDDHAINCNNTIVIQCGFCTQSESLYAEALPISAHLAYPNRNTGAENLGIRTAPKTIVTRPDWPQMTPRSQQPPLQFNKLRKDTNTQIDKPLNARYLTPSCFRLSTQFSSLKASREKGYRWWQKYRPTTNYSHCAVLLMDTSLSIHYSLDFTSS